MASNIGKCVFGVIDLITQAMVCNASIMSNRIDINDPSGVSIEEYITSYYGLDSPNRPNGQMFASMVREFDPIAADVISTTRHTYELAEAVRVMECALILDHVCATEAKHPLGSIIEQFVDELNFICNYLDAPPEVERKRSIVHDVGICTNVVMDMASSIIAMYAVTWSGHSGYFSYPVIDRTAPNKSPMEQYVYDHPSDKWDMTTEYGRQRRSLVDHLLQTAKKTLEEARKLADVRKEV